MTSPWVDVGTAIDFSSDDDPNVTPRHQQPSSDGFDHMAGVLKSALSSCTTLTRQAKLQALQKDRKITRNTPSSSCRLWTRISEEPMIIHPSIRIQHSFNTKHNASHITWVHTMKSLHNTMFAFKATSQTGPMRLRFRLASVADHYVGQALLKGRCHIK